MEEKKKVKVVVLQVINEKKIPAKVLRYFPLKPHLQRMFMSSKIAKHMQ